METTDNNNLVNKLIATVTRNAKHFTAAADKSVEMDHEHFLPNFCELKMTVSVLIIAELLALVITLVMPVPSIFFSNYFGKRLGLVHSLAECVNNCPFRGKTLAAAAQIHR